MNHNERVVELIRFLYLGRIDYFKMKPDDYRDIVVAAQKKLNSINLVKKTIIGYTGELDIILGNAYLLEGMANDKLDRRSKARESYNNCIKLENFSMAIELSEKYLKQPYSKD